MRDKERECSYEYYKQWQLNKIRYKHECVAYTLMFGVGLFFVLKNWQSIVLGLGIILVVGAVGLFLKIFLKWYNMRKGVRELENMLKLAGATNIKVDYEYNAVSFDFTSQFTDEKLKEFQNILSNMGLKMNVSRVEKEKNNGKNDMNRIIWNSSDLKSTQLGYINKNQQKNLGKTDEKGTDNNQYFYKMECLKCGYKYNSNGTDIWQRKCPKCQSGKP